MSSTLKYRPVGNGKSLSDQLKHALHGYLADPIRACVVHSTDEALIGYLLALENQKVPDAGKLLERIRHYESLELFEVF